MPNRSRIQRFAVLLLLLFMAWFTRCKPITVSTHPIYPAHTFIPPIPDIPVNNHAALKDQ